MLACHDRPCGPAPPAAGKFTLFTYSYYYYDDDDDDDWFFFYYCYYY